MTVYSSNQAQKTWETAPGTEFTDDSWVKKEELLIIFLSAYCILLPLVFTYSQDRPLLIKSCIGFLKANQIRTNVGLIGSQHVH